MAAKKLMNVQEALENLENLGVSSEDDLWVACRVQIWKKSFCESSEKFGYSFT